jgi:hypothetical protein
MKLQTQANLFPNEATARVAINQLRARSGSNTRIATAAATPGIVGAKNAAIPAARK